MQLSSQADKFAVALRLKFRASDKFRIFTSAQILKFYAGDKIISPCNAWILKLHVAYKIPSPTRHINFENFKILRNR